MRRWSCLTTRPTTRADGRVVVSEGEESGEAIVEGASVVDSPREPMIPRPAITLIALALTGGMLWNVVRGGSPTQTLILGGVVCSTFGVDWILKWLGR